MTENKQTLAQRLLAIQADSAVADWSYDGYMEIKSNPIRYNTLGQMKATLGPIFSKHGVVFLPSMARPEPLGSAVAPSGWLVKLNILLMNADDSEDTMSLEYYGQGSGEKAITVAFAYASKNFLSAFGFVAGGGDDPDAYTYKEEKKPTFIPQTPVEKAKAVNKIKENAAKAAPAKPVAPKEEAPVPAPAAEPAAEPAKKEVNLPAEIPETSVQTIITMLETLEQRANTEEIPAEIYQEALEAKDAITNKLSASAFIMKYRKYTR